ncbi:MAG: hypothetical protein NVSMB1_09200 [Polyangiales bacterium]
MRSRTAALVFILCGVVVSPSLAISSPATAITDDGTNPNQALHASPSAQQQPQSAIDARSRRANAPNVAHASVVASSLLVRWGRLDRKEISHAHRVSELADGTERWDFDTAISADETVARRDAMLRDNSFHGEVDVDLWRQAQLEPDDPGYREKNQWPLALINAPKAWDITTGDKNLVLAVVDTGYTAHPDLLPRIVQGYDFITDPEGAGDGDGRDQSPIDAGNESEESSGFHGTHIAGIIGAATNNHLGMAGVDWNCSIQPVRALGVKHHLGKDSDISDAIRWAAGINVPSVPQNKTPARVINLSFGGHGFSRVLQNAVSAAVGRGVLVIASAGNGTEDASLNYPSALEGVVAIAAAGPLGTMASYSDFGARIDLMAPGGSLYQDSPVVKNAPGLVWSTSFQRVGNQPVFAYAAGTSQAAAYASGIAALVRAAAPSLPPEVVAAVMRRASHLPKEGCDKGCGAGLIDASLAVAYAAQIAAAECPDPKNCGSNQLSPVALHPEEGCNLTTSARRPRGQRDSGAVAIFVGIVVVAACRRRRVLRPKGSRPIGRAHRSRRAFAPTLRALAWLPFPLFACGCAYGDQTRDAQSIVPLTITIVDPLPTLQDGDARIKVGAGLFINVTVSTEKHLESVELVAREPDLPLARLAHAPFRLFLPGWVPTSSPQGSRLVCVIATDATGNQGRSCFTAVP